MGAGRRPQSARRPWARGRGTRVCMRAPRPARATPFSYASTSDLPADLTSHTLDFHQHSEAHAEHGYR